MRRAICLAVCLLPAAVFAQSGQHGAGADEPTTIRGCLRADGFGWILYPNEPEHQTPGRVEDVRQGTRFSLAGDSDLMADLSNHERHEIDVTGHLTFLEPRSVAIVEAPRGFGRPDQGRTTPFGHGGASPDLFTDPGSSIGQSRTTPDGAELLLVTEFEHVSLHCRQ